jgi:hypothetical protein
MNAAEPNETSPNTFAAMTCRQHPQSCSNANGRRSRYPHPANTKSVLLLAEVRQVPQKSEIDEPSPNNRIEISGQSRINQIFYVEECHQRTKTGRAGSSFRPENNAVQEGAVMRSISRPKRFTYELAAAAPRRDPTPPTSSEPPRHTAVR